MSSRISLLAPAEARARLGASWDALASPRPHAALFSSTAWISAWCRHFGEGTRQSVIAVEDGDGLLAVMPVMRGAVRRGPALSVRFDFRPGDDKFMRATSSKRVLRLRQLSPIMGVESHNTRGGWRIRDGAQAAGIAGLVAGLRAVRGWSYALLPMPAGEIDAWLAVLRAAGLPALVRQGHRRFLVREQVASWADFVGAQSRNLRKNVKRSEQRAEAAGARTRVLVGDDARAALPQLFAIADASWKSRGREGEEIVVPLTAAARAFYGDLFATDAVRPLLILLTLGDRPMAAQLWAAMGADLYGVSTFHDPSVAELGPSRLLMAPAFDWAASSHIRWMDFNSTHDWCRPYADREDEVHQMLIFGGGIRGRMLHAMARRFNRADLLR